MESDQWRVNSGTRYVELEMNTLLGCTKLEVERNVFRRAAGGNDSAVQPCKIALQAKRVRVVHPPPPRPPPPACHLSSQTHVTCPLPHTNATFGLHVANTDDYIHRNCNAHSKAWAEADKSSSLNRSQKRCEGELSGLERVPA